MPLLRCLQACLLGAFGLTACGPDWDALLQVQRGDAGSSAVEFDTGASSAETEPNSDDPGSDDPGSDDPGSDDPGSDDPGSDEPSSAELGGGTSESVASAGQPSTDVGNDVSTNATLLPPASNTDDASLIGSFAPDGGVPDAGAVEPEALEQGAGNAAR